MAKKTDCDRCGQPAIATAVFSTSTTTEVKIDVCEACHAEYKKIQRAFTKQDPTEVVIEGEDIKVKNVK